MPCDTHGPNRRVAIAWPGHGVAVSGAWLRGATAWRPQTMALAQKGRWYRYLPGSGMREWKDRRTPRESSLAASDDEIFLPYTTYEHLLLPGDPLAQNVAGLLDVLSGRSSVLGTEALIFGEPR